MISKYFLLTLALFLTTLTLIQSCQMARGFLCLPDQFGCSNRGGKCTIRGRNCVCVSRSTFYGGYSPYGYGTFYAGRRRHVEPEQLRKRHPFSEYNIEQQTKWMTNFARMYNVIN